MEYRTRHLLNLIQNTRLCGQQDVGIRDTYILGGFMDCYETLYHPVFLLGFLSRENGSITDWLVWSNKVLFNGFCSVPKLYPTLWDPMRSHGLQHARLLWKWKWKSVMSDSLQPYGLYSPWNSPGQNTGVGSFSLLQQIFPTQESNWGLLHFRWILYQLSYQWSQGSSVLLYLLEFDQTYVRWVSDAV